MTDCDSRRELILEYAIGEPDTAERLEAEAHLAVCAACRHEVALHRELGADLTRLPAPSYPADLEQVILRAALQVRRSMGGPARIAPERARRRLPAMPVLCAIAGLALVALIAVLFLPGGLLGFGTMDGMVYGEPGRGRAFSETMKFLRNLQQGTELVARWTGGLAPIARALLTAVQAIGVGKWILAVASLGGALLILRRLTRGSTRRGTRHAKARG